MAKTKTTDAHRVADAMREVAMALQTEINDGRHSRSISADDLLETLLSIADRLDPAGRERPPLECPGCEQTDRKHFVWLAGGLVRCEACGGEFVP